MDDEHFGHLQGAPVRNSWWSDHQDDGGKGEGR